MAYLVVRHPHLSRKEVPELVGFGGMEDETVSGGGAGSGGLAKHQGFLTQVWRDRFVRLLMMYAPEKLYLAGAFLCTCLGVAMNGRQIIKDNAQRTGAAGRRR